MKYLIQTFKNNFLNKNNPCTHAVIKLIINYMKYSTNLAACDRITPFTALWNILDDST